MGILTIPFFDCIPPNCPECTQVNTPGRYSNVSSNGSSNPQFPDEIKINIIKRHIDIIHVVT